MSKIYFFGHIFLEFVLIINRWLRLNFLIIALSCVGGFYSCGLRAQNFEEVFLKANDFFVKNKYQEALDLYKIIENKGPLTFYNIGICNFKLNNYFDAILNFERAKRGASFALHKDLNQKILFLQKKLGKESNNKNYSSLLNAFFDFTDSFSTFSFQVIFALFWFLLALGCIFLKKIKKSFRKIILLINVIIILVSGCFLFAKYYFKSHPAALIKRNTAIFSGPNSGYYKLAEGKFAELVNVCGLNGDWRKIKYNGIIGWVEAQNLEII